MASAAPVVWIPGTYGAHQLRAGDVVHVAKPASVQFWHRPINFRVIRILECLMDAWVYLDGYELDHRGDAAERRTILVQPAGLKLLNKVADPRARNGRPVNAGRVLPRQRADADGRPANAPSRVRSRGEAGAR